MKEKDYYKVIKRIKKVLKKEQGVNGYNLSGSGWLDSYSSSEREKLHRKNEKAESRKHEYEELVIGMLSYLINSGFSKEEILAEFNEEEDKEIISQKIEYISSMKEDSQTKGTK